MRPLVAKAACIGRDHNVKETHLLLVAEGGRFYGRKLFVYVNETKKYCQT